MFSRVTCHQQACLERHFACKKKSFTPWFLIRSRTGKMSLQSFDKDVRVALWKEIHVDEITRRQMQRRKEAEDTTKGAAAPPRALGAVASLPLLGIEDEEEALCAAMIVDKGGSKGSCADTTAML